MSNAEGEKYKLFVALLEVLRIILIAAIVIIAIMSLIQ
jgi:hypothetical protein